MATEAVEWPDRMNPTDALFWLLDKIPEMRSTTAALLVLERAPSRQRIRAAFERLCENLPRLRQQVVPVPLALAPPEWVDDPQFDLDYHLRHFAVCEPCSLDSLLEELGPLYATAFDPERPLWEAYGVEGLLDGRGAVFVKLHHCVTDGIGGSRLFAELFGDRSEPDAVPLRLPALGRPTTTAALLWRALLYNLDDALRSGAGTLGAVRTAVRRPGEMLGGIRRGVRLAMGMGQELTGSRAESPLHHHRSLSRRLSTFEMALDEIDAVREALRATNNDIVLTVVSGAMHRWHTSRGSDVRELRAMVPVSVRGDEDAKAGNRLALLAVNLPIGEPNPLRRLRLIQARMGRIKDDRRATAYPLLARVLTIDDITDAADIARRSFYHHFDSKHALLVPIARAHTHSLNRRIDRLIEGLADPAEVVSIGMRHTLRGIVDDPLCGWFILRSGLPHDRLREGMGESAATSNAESGCTVFSFPTRPSSATRSAARWWWC